MATVEGQTAITRSPGIIPSGTGRNGARSAALSSNGAATAAFGWNAAQTVPVVDPPSEKNGNGGAGSRSGARRGGFDAGRQTDPGTGIAPNSSTNDGFPSPTGGGGAPAFGGRIAAAAAFLTQLLSSVTADARANTPAALAQGNGNPLTRTYAARAYGRPTATTSVATAPLSTVLPPLASGRTIDLSI